MSNFPGSLLILNGKSAGDDMLREAITLLRNEGMDIQVRVTWEKGDAERYVAEAIKLGVETVIAGGGDGTINESPARWCTVIATTHLYWGFCL
jgi:diacylglycerol kinase family enzyme